MMKKGIMVLFIFISGAVLFTGCEKEKVFISNEIIQDSEQWYGKVITSSDFPADKVLDVSYADTVNTSLSSGDVGSTPETALVPLVFDRQTLVLYTAKRFNQEMDESLTNGKSMDIVEYLTDIKTFHEVTGLEQAHPKYAHPMPGPNDQAVWSFDPYVKFFTQYDGYVEKQSIDQRIIEMVQKATNDPVLQKEMQEEIQFLVNYQGEQIHDLRIKFDDVLQDFVYVVGGDQVIVRESVQNDMREQKEKQSIDQRIVGMVQQATNDPVLQKEMQEELQFLIDTNVAEIETIRIEFDNLMNDFDYFYNGDQAAPRFWIRQQIEPKPKDSFSLIEGNFFYYTQKIFLLTI